ncbi:MAG: hypothetical protein JWP61_1008 [Friedmanniella sp.]|nr:hypothetical protein [Friedmanniella sp.]
MRSHTLLRLVNVATGVGMSQQVQRRVSPEPVHRAFVFSLRLLIALVAALLALVVLTAWAPQVVDPWFLRLGL